MSQGSVFSSLSECQTPLSIYVSRVPEQPHMAEPTPSQVCAGLSGHGPTNETVCDPWPCAPADAIGSFVRLACVRVRGAAGAVWPCMRVGESPALSAAPGPPAAGSRAVSEATGPPSVRHVHKVSVVFVFVFKFE